MLWTADLSGSIVPMPPLTRRGEIGGADGFDPDIIILVSLFHRSRRLGFVSEPLNRGEASSYVSRSNKTCSVRSLLSQRSSLRGSGDGTKYAGSCP